MKRVTHEQHPRLGTFTESIIVCETCGVEAPSSRRFDDDRTLASTYAAARDGFTSRLFGAHLRDFCGDGRLFAAGGKELHHA